MGAMLVPRSRGIRPVELSTSMLLLAAATSRRSTTATDLCADMLVPGYEHGTRWHAADAQRTGSTAARICPVLFSANTTLWAAPAAHTKKK